MEALVNSDNLGIFIVLTVFIVKVEYFYHYLSDVTPAFWTCRSNGRM